MNRIAFGTAALAAGVTILMLSIAIGAVGVEAGGGSPTATPDPTVDPCSQFKPPLPATCVPTQPPRSEDQDTPTPSATATETAEPELGEPTSTPRPASTATPGGGAGAGGVAPPDTGTGTGTETRSNVLLLVLIGTALAIGGGATVVQGVRRGR